VSIYLITFFLFFVFSYLELRSSIDETQKNILQTILFLFLVFQIGLRWETGTDWLPYLNHFLNTSEINIVLIEAFLGFELGYGIMVYIVRLFTDNYTIFLVIHSLIFYFLIFKANKKLSPFPIISLMLIYALTIGYLGSNRQLLALALCLYSLKFVLAKRPIRFFLLVFVAFLFHSSALIFAVYYFLNRDFKKRNIIGVLFLAIVIGQSMIPNLLFSGIGDYLQESARSKIDFYSNIVDNSSVNFSLSGHLRRLFYFILFFTTYNTISKKIKTYRLLFNGFVFSLIIFFLFSNSIVILISRGNLYFSIMETFLLASQLLVFKYKRDRVIVLFFLVLYAVYVFFQSISTYEEKFIPYQGIIINSEFYRDMY